MPTKVSELQASVLQWQTRTRIMGDSAAAGMESSYRVVLDTLEPSLAALQARIQAKRDAGEDFSPSWLFREQRYQELIRQTKILVGQYAAFAQQNMTPVQMAAVQAAYLEGVRQMRLAGVDPGASGSVARGFASINQAAVTNLVGAMQAETPLGAVFSSFAPDATEAVKTSLVRDFALGLGIDKIVRNMRQEFALPGQRAARIARTEILRATNEGLRDSFIKSGVVKKWRWSAALSIRTCPACLAQNGKVFPLTTPMQRHVQCRCSMSPYLGDGTDAVWVDGDTWIRAQDDDVQDKILGRAGGAAFRAGQVELPDFSYLHTNSTWGDSYQARSWSSVANNKGLPVDYIGSTAPGGTQGATGGVPVEVLPAQPAPGAAVPSQPPAWKPSMTAAEAEAWAAGSVDQRVFHHGTTSMSADGIRSSGFDLDRKAAGRVFGNGVYMTPEKDVADWYASLASSGNKGGRLDLRVNVRKVFRIDDNERPDDLGPVWGRTHMKERALSEGDWDLLDDIVDAVSRRRVQIYREMTELYEGVETDAESAAIDSSPAMKKLEAEMAAFSDDPEGYIITRWLEEQGYDALEIVGGAQPQLMVIDPKRIVVVDDDA